MFLRRWRAGPDPLSVVLRIWSEVKARISVSERRLVQAARARSPYSSRVRLRSIPCWLFLQVCVAIPCFPQVQAAEVRIEQGYEWPGRAVLRWSVSQGDPLIVSRSEHPACMAGVQNAAPGVWRGAPVLGVCLPWFLYGPLLARGMLRQVFDPLAFAAWSGVFEEHTGLVLDGALQTSRAGVLLMPSPGHCGVFCRPGREGGTEYGAFGSLQLGAGAAECAVLASRPDAQPSPDEWFITRAPFPGGDLTHFAARLILESPNLAASYAAGASSAQFAAPGVFSALWIRGRLPEIEGAVLVSGATPGYRTPDGASTTVASRLSAMVRLGRDRRRGELEAGFSFAAAEPGFSPRREIPTKNVVRAALSRDYLWACSWPLSVLLEAQKDINRDCDGVRNETFRCGSTACLALGSMDVTASVDSSDHDGVGVLGGLTLKPSSRLRIGVEAKGKRLGTPCPTGSMSMKLALEEGGRRAALQTGLDDYPLESLAAGPAPALAGHFRLSLSCSLLCR